MIVNAYVVIDPKGDRPYLTSKEPKDLKLENGVEIYHYMLFVPDKHKMSNSLTMVSPETSE